MAETIEELRERASLLQQIAQLEESAEWTDIEELRERTALLREIAQHEDNRRDAWQMTMSR
jgi:hypothetical protein